MTSNVRALGFDGMGRLYVYDNRFAPPIESFRRGRDFSAWRGLVPRQHTTRGKPA